MSARVVAIGVMLSLLPGPGRSFGPFSALPQSALHSISPRESVSLEHSIATGLEEGNGNGEEILGKNLSAFNRYTHSLLQAHNVQDVENALTAAVTRPGEVFGENPYRFVELYLVRPAEAGGYEIWNRVRTLPLPSRAQEWVPAVAEQAFALAPAELIRTTMDPDTEDDLFLKNRDDERLFRARLVDRDLLQRDAAAHAQGDKGQVSQVYYVVLRNEAGEPRALVMVNNWGAGRSSIFREETDEARRNHRRHVRRVLKTLGTAALLALENVESDELDQVERMTKKMAGLVHDFNNKIPLVHSSALTQSQWDEIKPLAEKISTLSSQLSATSRELMKVWSIRSQRIQRTRENLPAAREVVPPVSISFEQLFYQAALEFISAVQKGNPEELFDIRQKYVRQADVISPDPQVGKILEDWVTLVSTAIALREMATQEEDEKVGGLYQRLVEQLDRLRALGQELSQDIKRFPAQEQGPRKSVEIIRGKLEEAGRVLQQVGTLLGMEMQWPLTSAGEAAAAKNQRRDLESLLLDEIFGFADLHEKEGVTVRFPGGVQGLVPTGLIPLTEEQERVLRKTFENLLNNALVHSSPTRKPIITVRVTYKKKLLEVSIEDNGAGVSRVRREPMLRGEFSLLGADQRALALGRGSSGVGLADVSDELIQLGGKLWLETSITEGETDAPPGSTFRFRLPLERTQPEEPAFLTGEQLSAWLAAGAAEYERRMREVSHSTDAPKTVPGGLEEGLPTSVSARVQAWWAANVTGRSQRRQAFRQLDWRTRWSLTKEVNRVNKHLLMTYGVPPRSVMQLLPDIARFSRISGKDNESSVQEQFKTGLSAIETFYGETSSLIGTPASIPWTSMPAAARVSQTPEDFIENLGHLSHLLRHVANHGHNPIHFLWDSVLLGYAQTNQQYLSGISRGLKLGSDPRLDLMRIHPSQIQALEPAVIRLHSEGIDYDVEVGPTGQELQLIGWRAVPPPSLVGVGPIPLWRLEPIIDGGFASGGLSSYFVGWGNLSWEYAYQSIWSEYGDSAKTEFPADLMTWWLTGQIQPLRQPVPDEQRLPLNWLLQSFHRIVESRNLEAAAKRIQASYHDPNALTLEDVRGFISRTMWLLRNPADGLEELPQEVAKALRAAGPEEEVVRSVVPDGDRIPQVVVAQRVFVKVPVADRQMDLQPIVLTEAGLLPKEVLQEFERRRWPVEELLPEELTEKRFLGRVENARTEWKRPVFVIVGDSHEQVVKKLPAYGQVTAVVMERGLAKRLGPERLLSYLMDVLARFPGHLLRAEYEVRFGQDRALYISTQL